MKKRFYLLIPIIFLIGLGLVMIPAKAATINDAQNDVIGMQTWVEDDKLKLDCNWVPDDSSMIDIQTISWVDAGSNYTVTMTFYGTPNATAIEEAEVSVMIMFLINGSTYPDDLETESPESHLTISSAAGGTVIGNQTSVPYVGVMQVSGNSLIWSFNKSIEPVAPIALENWDLVAFAGFSYNTEVDGVTYTNLALDHYNFDYMEESLTAACLLLNIPGYSPLIIGVIAVVTIGVIIKTNQKKK